MFWSISRFPFSFAVKTAQGIIDQLSPDNSDKSSSPLGLVQLSPNFRRALLTSPLVYRLHQWDAGR